MKPETIGEYLRENEFILKEAYEGALLAQENSDRSLSEFLVHDDYLYYLNEDRFLELLGKLFNLSLFTDDDVDLADDVVELIPEAVARRHQLVPLALRGDIELMDLVVGCIEPIPPTVMEHLGVTTQKIIRPVLLTKEDFEEYFHQAYPQSGELELVSVISEEENDDPVHIVNRILLDAVNQRASDIHMEPGDRFFRVRYRIDGVLRNVGDIPFDLMHSVMSRLKVMANMDISQRRKLQEGAFVFEHPELVGPSINVRVSCLPCKFGENAVLRLLPTQEQILGIDSLGMRPEILIEFRRILSSPHGLFLVTGPTASGKTTTLYSIIDALLSESINVSTIEDPIEIVLPGINQLQVDRHTDITFANALRSFLRQDPDILMVGEIRDSETAHVALRAAHTGHLVLSSMHTNDSPSAFNRLLDMGVEPFLVASSVRAVLAQRLVRVNCPHCVIEREANADELNFLGINSEEMKTIQFGLGCNHCQDAGFIDRTGLFELLTVDEELHHLIIEGGNPKTLREYMRRKKIHTLLDDGIQKIKEGITTPEEVIRATMKW